MRLAQLFAGLAMLLGGGLTFKAVFQLVVGKGTTPEAQRWISIGVFLFGIGFVLSNVSGTATALVTVCEVGVIKPLCGNSEEQKAEENRIRLNAERETALLRAELERLRAQEAQKAEAARKGHEAEMSREAARIEKLKAEVEAERRRAWEAENSPERRAQRVADHMQKSLAFRRERNYQAALGELNRAMDLNTHDADVLYQRAIIFGCLGRREDAMRDVDLALRMRPEHPQLTQLREYIRNRPLTCS